VRLPPTWPSGAKFAKSRWSSIIQHLKKVLKQVGVEAEITGRPKHIYSIYKKIERKGVPFEMVHDIRGVRILVNDIPVLLCNPGRDPYPLAAYARASLMTISPCLRTTFTSPCILLVVYDDGKTLEVQIRTHEMNQNAELGIAAHWRIQGRRIPG
jgi:GTP pyrophosphokinase